MIKKNYETNPIPFPGTEQHPGPPILRLQTGIGDVSPVVISIDTAPPRMAQVPLTVSIQGRTSPPVMIPVVAWN